MIVRISNEGQYEISDEDLAELNQLDNEAVACCESSDESISTRCSSGCSTWCAPRDPGAR